MKNKLNLAAAIWLAALMLAVGCGAQAGAEQNLRFTGEQGSEPYVRVVTDNATGCKYGLYSNSGTAWTVLYGTDGKPLGCGEVSK
ncbi:hypothetical protein [Tumebacillus permanentifrigoris]|uniref:Uncharacterized protein n=1 Tax=Tumebacillus permanentifrigoris TaxID=378543 RepID=A0A316D4F8_9BACL|nr:hypothetical protein [Tumebacillus permanentifrigoris]PWK03953.1 hypothetical protein C7459_1389 [Tumebacillus permanentifrigoris]